ncbi:MAG TPA: PTS sugar transporter subunit IIC [Gemmatimonadaceae bacterium]|nr:PTS sugar transporter subunit IIC [Gemmatimonadaceae bacterium]
MISAILPLSLLGAVLGLDTVSFPQAMLSRPLVSATLGGALVGAPGNGLLVGAVLELIALETLPFGASRYPEWGSASVVGGALFASSARPVPGAMSLALLAALATAWVGGWTMVRLRQRNGRWAAKAQPALDAGARGTVIGLQLRGMTADLVRGALLTAIAVVVFAPINEASLAVWSIDARESRAVTIGLALSVAVAASWKLLHASIPARWLFVAGLAAGFALTGTL